MKYSTMYWGFVALSATMACIMVAQEARAGCETVYARLGTGYKIAEEHKFRMHNGIFDRKHNSPYTARLEFGCRSGNWSYGIAHHSQWLVGWPVDNNGEPYKTEFFIDYEWSWDIGG